MGKQQSHKRSWTDFWADNAAQGGGGCLPSKWLAIDRVQGRIWKDFAERLPRRPRLLDLATGDGRVMRWILEARRDARPVGVDLASTLPPPPAGAKIRTGVAMEELPFPAAGFAAVTSQFGFEYGETEQVAAEAARVLAADGEVALMTHRIDGPILAHNRARRDAIRWAVEHKQLIELARQSLSLRAAGITTIPPAVAAAPEEGTRLFGKGSAAWEIAEAIRQTLVLGRNDSPAQVARLIEAIAAKARNELGRIDSLEAACETTADDIAFREAIAAAGLEQNEIEPLAAGEDQPPFADFRTFVRAA